MAQSIVQHTQTQSTTTVSSLSKAFGSNNASNNLLVYAGVWDRLAPAPTISDTGNTANIASSVGPTTSVLNGGTGRVWHAPKCVAGANTVQLAWGAPNPGFAGIYIHEYTDTSHASGFAFDQNAATTGTSANPASGNTPTTTQANEIVFGLSFSDGVTPTAGAGFAIEESDTVLNGIATEDKFVTSTGAQNAVFTEASSDWAALCATFYTIADSGVQPKSQVFRAGRGPSPGPLSRRMMPQKFPDTFPAIVELTASSAAPFRPGRKVGPSKLRRLPQQFPSNVLNTYTLPSSVGTYTLTGIAAGLQHGDDLIAAGGTYTLSGQAANLLKGFVLSAASGAYSLSGQSANLLHGSILGAVKGAYLLTGQNANTLAGRVVPATPGAYNLTGSAAGSLHTYVLAAAPGAYNLAGNAANLIYSANPSTPGGDMPWMRRRRR